MDPRGVIHILAECGALKRRGAGRAPTRSSRQWRFVPRQATFLGNYTPKVAVFAHPTDAAGTKGEFEGGTTSIVASFDFHPLKTRKLSQIPAR